MLRHLPATSGLCAGATRRAAAAGRPHERRSSLVVDLGSGDGRVMIAAARQGHLAVGYEFNPWLVLYSRISSFAAGVSPLFFRLRHIRGRFVTILTRNASRSQDNAAAGATESIVTPAGGGCARFFCGNMWNAPVADATCIVIYGVEELMPRFANKLEQELPLPHLSTSSLPGPTRVATALAPTTRGGRDPTLQHRFAPVVVLCNTFPLPGPLWAERLVACEEGVFVYHYWTRAIPGASGGDA